MSEESTFPLDDPMIVGAMVGDGGVPDAGISVTRDWENAPGVTDEMRTRASQMRLEMNPLTNTEKYTESQIRDEILKKRAVSGEEVQEDPPSVKEVDSEPISNEVWIERDGRWVRVAFTDVKPGEFPTTFPEGEEPEDGDLVQQVPEDEKKEKQEKEGEEQKEKENKLDRTQFVEAVGAIMWTFKENEDALGDDAITLKNKEKRRGAKKSALILLKKNGVDVDYLMGGTGIDADDPFPGLTRAQRRDQVKLINTQIQYQRIVEADGVDEILKKMNVTDAKLVEWRVLRVEDPNKRVRTPAEPIPDEPPSPPEPGAVPNERGKKEKKNESGRVKITTLEELDNFLKLIQTMDFDRAFVLSTLKSSYQSLGNELFGGETSEERKKKVKALVLILGKLIKDYGQEAKTGVDNIDPGQIPDKDAPRSEWVTWFRDRLQRMIDPLSATGRSRERGGVIFDVYETDPKSFQKRKVDGSAYAPRDLRDEVLEAGGEREVLENLTGVFEKWKSYHKDFKTMSTRAFEENSDYGHPDSKTSNLLLHNLKDENDIPGEGSKKISLAVQIYWAMANLDDPKSAEILYKNGLPPGFSLFSDKYSNDYVEGAREHISNVVGGAYYENIALMYVNFLGLAAKGSTGKYSSIPDPMSSMYNIGKLEESIPPSILAAMTVSDSNGSKKVSFMPSLKELQMKDGVKKNFYVMWDGYDQAFYLKKELGPGEADSGWSIDDLVKEGKLHQIDWEKGTVNLFDEIKGKEKQAVKVFSVFDSSSLSDTATEIFASPEYSGKTIAKKLSTITESLSHYDLRTRQRVYAMWLWRQLAYNKTWWKENEQVSINGIVKLMRYKGTLWSRRQPFLCDADYRELAIRFNLSDKADKSYNEKGKKWRLWFPSNWKYGKTGIPPRTAYR